MHSWIKANGDDSDSNATFDERISDIIPSTCGGGRRRISIGSVLSRHNNSISPFITPPRPENKAKKNQYPSKNLPFDTRSNNNVFNTTPKTKGQKSAEKSKINLVAARKETKTPPQSYSPFSEDEEIIRRLREKIEKHPLPGNGATRLQQLVNLPWRVCFGPPESRGASSRELEVQRAGSSFKRIYTPLHKDFEPEIPLRDTPEIVHRSNQQNLIGQKNQHQQTEVPLPTTSTPQHRTFSRNSSRQDKQIQTDDVFEGNKNILYKNRHQSTSQFSTSSSRRDSAFTSKFSPTHFRLSPLHYQRPPPLPPPINLDSWALGPRHYRRVHLDGMCKGIRETEITLAKLRAQFKRFDEKSKQELDELELLNREHELDVRRRQFEESLVEQNELEKSVFNSNNSQLPSSRPLPPPILKKTTLPRASRNSKRVEIPRVAFSSPFSSSTNRSEDRRIDYAIKWQSNQDQLKKAKRANSHINLKSNPTSIFQHIPGSSSITQPQRVVLFSSKCIHG
ncbi:hypothetical protein Mgra_00007978 [Meloidogyne graminicola]|uniref:Uncharacterized protein n=1 Tax=Meloidogyne graminicola TaxID=189291 RepID=A0A8S9ZH90_9BILA|nr:hypothetical protein Mgra_00007978 [Meloidogyne graminicola]